MSASRPRLAKRTRRLGLRDWLLLAEASLVVAVASAGIAVLPFRRLSAWMSRPAQPGDGDGAAAASTVGRVRWAVEATSRRLPWRTVCFQKGLALHWMLQRRRLGSRLHYGVGRSDEGALKAHVWVSWRGSDVIGGDVAQDFTCLATYPSESRTAQ